MTIQLFSKTIGIIGGAGPMASAFLYSELLRTSQRLYQSNDYNEFPEIVLISYPFIRGQKEKIQKDLAACFRRIEKCGAQVICIASHSFHGYLPDSVPKGFVNLIDEGLKEAKNHRITKALILAAPLTISMKLYERTKIQCVYPDTSDQEVVNEIIREIAGGNVNENQSRRIRGVIQSALTKNSFDGIIIACTELPLAHANQPFMKEIQVIDTAQVIAKQLVLLAH